MGTLWYCLIAFMLVGYVILDGYDLGAGVIHLAVAKTDTERRQVLQSIGPLWDGNEVWLVAMGGTLFFAFPRLYAASFSGFYLPLMMVLWLLVGRGIAIEFRSHFADPAWRPFWDVVFAFASGLLALVFGVALGNVLRGVALDPTGKFFIALWTDFGAAPPVGALDWYTTTIGLFSLATLTHHGSLWIALRTRDELRERARRAARLVWPAVVVLGAVATAMTFRIQPQLSRNLERWPWGAIFPVLALGGLIASRVFSARLKEHAAFVASAAAIAGMLGSAAFGVYPYVLPSIADPGLSLSIDNTLAGSNGLALGLMWWFPGMALAVIYAIYVHWKFSGPIQPGADGH
jgi:cytochrome d ubiquinol oxidase subunit II